MLSVLTRLLSGAVTPLTDQLADFGARLFRKLALFFVAGLCLAIVLIALTIAFDLWVASRAGPIAGALAVAGLYLAVAVTAIALALRDTSTSGVSKPQTEAETKTARANAERDTQIDAFTAPILALLEKVGLKREQLAVLAGASIAKQIGPLPLVGFAILAGFLAGRMVKSWRRLVSLEMLSALLSGDLFGLGKELGIAPEAKD